MADDAKDLPTLFSPQTLQRKGLCRVTKVRGQEDSLHLHSLYYEVHGSGPEHLVFVMGLNSSSFAWIAQVEHFSKNPKYSILVFDNRGVGNSTTPRGPYSTRGMADDIVVLLDLIGWTEQRSIHIIGVSLGGMVSQELATVIPERIISLTLGVTTPGGYFWQNLFDTPFEGTKRLARLTFTTDPAQKINIILPMVYTIPWLESPSEEDPSKTNKEVQSAMYLRRIEVTRPQQLIGHLSQMASALTHRVTPDRLRMISKSIPKVLIITGDQDHLVRPSNSLRLKKEMPEAEYIQWKDCGHVIHGQYQSRFNDLLERIFAEGRAKLVGTDVTH
ncbi:alpha/beta-hydrolase [Auriculariales sp. MPI-PUGE-AT-0066]|nr:alpha/beta-hydrolase [Auriculariales sp. MPI-PUGE-AT-0066]